MVESGMPSSGSAPLPHTPLNHFLKTAKAKLLRKEELEDAVYLITSPQPTLDQIVGAIAYAYFETQLQLTAAPSSAKKVYVPVVQAKRSTTFGAALPALTLALQTSLIAPENLVFLDDLEWRTANAYGRNKNAITVGGTSSLALTAETVNEWEEVHGMRIIGFIDTPPPPIQLADIQVKIVAPEAELNCEDPETGLSSLVALFFKPRIAQTIVDPAPSLNPVIPKELADLIIAAIVTKTDNLAESKTSYLDQGAVGFLEPKSSFQGARAVETDAEGPEESHSTSAFVPIYPDLDSYFRALRSEGDAAHGATLSTKLSGFDAGDAVLPMSFEWNLIHGSLLPNVPEAQPVPDYAKKVIVGEFLEALTSSAAMKLLRPYGIELAKAAGNSSTADGDSLDLSRVSLDDVVSAVLASSPSSVGELLCIAVASLHSFVQVNWTGPDLPSDLTPYSLLRTSASQEFPPRKVEEEEMEKDARRIGRIMHRASLDALVFKGEPAYHLCQSPFFLVFAKAVLEALWRHDGLTGSTAGALETLAWWRLRASTVHSHVLDEPAAFGKTIFEPVANLVDKLDSYRATYDQVLTNGERKNPWASLLARLILERGVALQRIGNDREASEKFVEAAKVNGLRYRLGGALGMRTKYQKEAKTQLVLLAKSEVVDGSKDDEERSGGVVASGEPSRSATESSQTGRDAKEAEAELPEAGWQAKVEPKDQVAGMPSTYALNDDLLLEQTQFTSTSTAEGHSSSGTATAIDDLAGLDPNNQPPLAVLDQCTLLALCLNIRNTQPTHGLTSNQMSSFISRVISHPRNWMVHTMSLLLRARLEATRTRTVERSVLQLQALIDQMPTSDSGLQERLKFFHALDLPPKWEMQAELARRYASLGVTRSALEIFERIELWEEVVHCLSQLSRQQEGIEVIRDLLQGSKIEADVDLSRRKRLGLLVNDSTAQQVMFGRLDRARESKLWCILGDLEPSSAERHYAQAWSVSRSSSARAARSLGGFHFARQDYAESARWLRSALKINPLFSRSWFVLGCSYMRLERWKEAATCFRRCTALDEEDGESWNNLASCYLRMSEAQDAVDVETYGGHTGRNMALLEDDDYDDIDEDAWSTPSDGEELSDRSDSGVELSTDESGTETETETEDVDTETEGDGNEGERAAMRSLGQLQRRRAPRQSTQRRAGRDVGTGPSYNLKLLAHRSLGKALKFSHDNWRVWSNYMIVSIDVGMLSDATSAMARTVEIRTKQTGISEAEKQESVDMAVLQRLVDAVLRGDPPYKLTGDDVDGGDRPGANYGLGLYRRVRALFDDTLLTRISSSPAIYTLYGRLLEWSGENGKAVSAYLNAFRATAAGNAADDGIANDLTQFKKASEEVEKIVGILLRLGPQPAVCSAGPTTEDTGKAMDDYKFQARSIVRTFVARTKEAFEDEDEWMRLKAMMAELR